MGRVLLYAGLIGMVLMMGSLVGILNPPGAWYASLRKPDITPPDWLFAPVWTALYVMIGWVGARKLRHGGAGTLWVLQMALNFAYEPLFLGMQAPVASLVVAICLLWSILAFILAEWRADRLSAVLFLPYAGWIAIVVAVNVGIVALN